jgi:hypothetical protein
MMLDHLPLEAHATDRRTWPQILFRHSVGRTIIPDTHYSKGMNSGFMHPPESGPQDLSDFFLEQRDATCSKVPGNTVLRTLTATYYGAGLESAPMFVRRRSNIPDAAWPERRIAFC